MSEWKAVLAHLLPSDLDLVVVVREDPEDEWETDVLTLVRMLEEGDEDDFDGVEWRLKRPDEVDA